MCWASDGWHHRSRGEVRLNRFSGVVVKKLSCFLVTGCVTAIAVAGGALPAQADDLSYSVPKRVMVNQAYENIAWRVVGADLPLVDNADATLEHVVTRESAGFDFASAPPISGTFQFYDFNRMGRYQVDGAVYDADFNELPAAPGYVVIKRASRSGLTATRSGRLVTLRGVTRQYTGGFPLWPAYRGNVVRYQRYVAGAWKTIALRKVPASGVTRLTVRRAAAARYRVRVFDQPAVWGSSSRIIRK
jgi:hypothetical protein